MPVRFPAPKRIAGGLVTASAVAARDFSSFSNHRVMFWRTAFEMTADEPLSGIGLAGFPYEFPAAYAKRHGPVAVTDSATNALLDVAAECGLPGLLLALLAVVPLLARAFDAAFARGPIDPASRAAGAALAGLFVACQTGSHPRFFEIAPLTALVAGFLLVPHLTSARTARLRRDVAPLAHGRPPRGRRPLGAAWPRADRESAFGRRRGRASRPAGRSLPLGGPARVPRRTPGERTSRSASERARTTPGGRRRRRRAEHGDAGGAGGRRDA